MQTNVLVKEVCILKNKNKLCPYKKLSMFYNSCLKTFGSHLVFIVCVAYHKFFMYFVFNIHDIDMDSLYAYFMLVVLLRFG
jgi:hypothetical protein